MRETLFMPPRTVDVPRFSTKQVVEMLRPHHSVQEISELLGVSQSVVSKIGTRTNVRSNSKPRQMMRNLTSQLVCQGTRVTDIARMAKCSPQHVYDLLAEVEQ